MISFFWGILCFLVSLRKFHIAVLWAHREYQWPLKKRTINVFFLYFLVYSEGIHKNIIFISISIKIISNYHSFVALASNTQNIWCEMFKIGSYNLNCISVRCVFSSIIRACASRLEPRSDHDGKRKFWSTIRTRQKQRQKINKFTILPSSNLW